MSCKTEQYQLRITSGMLCCSTYLFGKLPQCRVRIRSESRLRK